MDLSIVVPLHNEEQNVQPLHERLTGVLKKLDLDYEILMIDDGSTDRTFTFARDLATVDKRLRVIRFRRNYGQTPALAAGIDGASGAVIVTIDGDLQNDPEDIPRLLEKMDAGYDIVVGWRHKRRDPLLTRRLPSLVANRLIARITGSTVHDHGCTLKAFRAGVIKRLPLYSDMHRMIPAIAGVAAPSIGEIRVRHHPRRSGSSKYGMSRVVDVLLSLITLKLLVGFSAHPLRWFALMAIPSFLVAGLLAVGSIVGVSVASLEPLPMAGSGLFFASLSIYLVFQGVLAELISKTSHEPLTRFPLLTAKEMTFDRRPELTPDPGAGGTV